MEYITIEEADLYFATRANASTYWKSGVDKQALLTTAQWQIENCGSFQLGVPYTEQDGWGNISYLWRAFISGDVIPQVIKDAICEQALFLAVHGADILKREGLIAQGVTNSSVVGEAFQGRGKGITIAPSAMTCLSADYLGGSSGSIPWER